MRRPHSIHKVFASYITGVVLVTLAFLGAGWIWTELSRHRETRMSAYYKYLADQDKRLHQDMLLLNTSMAHARQIYSKTFDKELLMAVDGASMVLTALHSSTGGWNGESRDIVRVLSDLSRISGNESKSGSFFAFRPDGSVLIPPVWLTSGTTSLKQVVDFDGSDVYNAMLGSKEQPEGSYVDTRWLSVTLFDSTFTRRRACVKYVPAFNLYLGYDDTPERIEKELRKELLIALETNYRISKRLYVMLFGLDGRMFLNRMPNLNPGGYLWNFADSHGLPIFEMMLDSASGKGTGFVNYHYSDELNDTKHRIRMHMCYIKEWDQIMVIGESADSVFDVVGEAVDRSLVGVRVQLISFSLFILVLAVLLVGVSFWFSRRIRHGLDLFTRRMSEALRQRTEMVVDEFRFLELQQLAVAFSTLLKKRERVLSDLLESEERYRMIAFNVSDIIFTLTPDFRFSFVSPSVHQMLAYLPEQILLLSPESFLEIQHHRRVRVTGRYLMSRRYSAAERPKRVTVEFDMKRADGERVPVEVFINQVFDAKGNFLYLLGVARDISERRKAQVKLSESESRYRMISDNVRDVIWSCNNQMEFTYVSQAAFYLSGYQPDDLIGVSIKKILTPEGYSKLMTMLEDSQQGVVSGGVSQKSLVMELEHQHLNGKTYLAEMSISPVYKDRVQLIAFHGITRDISERIKAGQELLQSERKLREINASKDKFFSILAHDLRNPFSSLLGFASVLAERFDLFSDNEKVTIINQLKVSSESAYRLIENLLEWSRTQTNSLQLYPTSFDFSVLVYEAIRLHASQATRKRIEVTSEIPPGTMVYADKNMLGTVIRNLISNAKKFSFERGRVVVSYETSGDMITITVTDDGIGIPGQILPRLFRIDEKIKTNGTFNEPGSGLGLILCREFIIRNGGTLWVESESGKGSRFNFCLPVR